ncbi:TPA: thioredoxin-disulfide reductase [Candidatus Dependentiae bacterium]|nr:MAG: Thioredoxin reductase [candidate division TM6 bacterium GW2011_GWE2_31_21]KKP53953.1 MAG: Thioredoxin reductase [candidate division TM6 bacterium GW2011_GWF2_33_332]HBS47733.1 thioredoxin-disulfide reductase [Candidatus Dependentiae bacterium]HBZ73882.1 thioredoxin-disulfide reductase [Candidatus Dependentiae bacterium]
MKRKVVIIGSGPAGLTAAIYTARAKLNPLVIEGNSPGGQLVTTTYIENWPGEKKILGAQLMNNIREHAKAYGAEIISDLAVNVDFSSQPYKIFTQSGKIIESDSVIIATGASHRKLNIGGEKEYWGRGVGTCATCDGPFFAEQDVVIIGGGNTAVTEASFLCRFAKKITIIQNLETLSANDPIKDEVLADPKINVVYNSLAMEIVGDGQNVTGVKIKNQKDNSTSVIPARGVFVAIGFKPNTEIFKNHLEVDSYGYLKLSGSTQTSKEGIFAAGDVADFKYMQAIVSSGFGCMAALDCEIYLRGKKKE